MEIMVILLCFLFPIGFGWFFESALSAAKGLFPRSFPLLFFLGRDGMFCRFYPSETGFLLAEKASFTNRETHNYAVSNDDNDVL